MQAGFGQITLKLKEMYQMITLGGDAELELVDSLDPFSEVSNTMYIYHTTCLKQQQHRRQFVTAAGAWHHMHCIGLLPMIQCAQ